jgi:hypothetical protein
MRSTRTALTLRNQLGVSAMLRTAFLFLTTGLLAYATAAQALNVSLINTDVITNKFENSMAIAKQLLDRFPPPKYMIYKIVVTFSVTDDLEGSGEGKIPVGVLSAGFKGDYEKLTTRKQSFTYVPTATIPTNIDDFGVLRFINQIQAKVSADLKTAPFVRSRAEYEEEFVVGVGGDGNLSFLGVASLSGSVRVKNSHTIKFYFCLMTNEGKCAEEK